MDFDKIKPLTAQDESTFQRYKAGIEKAVRETFPSLPADFEAKAVGINVINACALMYTYMIALPDGNFAKVKFVVGGMPVPGMPMDAEPTYTVDPEVHSSFE